MIRIDRIGERFGRLIVLSFAGRSKGGDALWRCRCDCGIIKIILGSHLQSGHAKSCGCLRRDMMRQRQEIHGESRPGQRSKEFRAWAAMKQRCLDNRRKDYKYYGGRGIKVCQRWLNSFENFLLDVGRAPTAELSIDRINNDGNYEPGNVRWATRLEQNQNKRRTQ